MAHTEKLNTDSLLTDLGGCGKFQVLLTLLINLSVVPAFLSFFVETFGIYNPGWKCVDDANSSYLQTSMAAAAGARTTANTAASDSTSAASILLNYSSYSDDGLANLNRTNLTKGLSAEDKMWTEYGMYSCPAFESCRNVEFSPDAATIVTEWSLTCNRGWILSTMLSIRMAGYLCSTLVVGYVGDRFGRKFPYLTSRLLLIILNLASMFSVSWQMYAVVSFFMGLVGSFGMLVGVTMNEYVAPDWRIKIASIPTWSIMSVAFAVLAMTVSDWKTMRLITTVTGVVVFIPLVIWMPESLRWMSVNGEKKDVMKLVTRVANVNKAPVPQEDKIESLIKKNKSEKKKSSYTIFHLFRKGYRMPTIVIGFVCFSTDIIYFAFQFGVAALPGNFYINLIIFSVTDLPATFSAFLFANKFSRKPTIFVMFGLASLCIFGIVAIDLVGSGQLKEIGMIVAVMVSKLFLYIGWIVLTTSMLELYPTVVRSTVNGFAWFCSSIGGIFAPYLIPSDPSTFYICYLAMAILSLVCTVLVLFFPETKGKPLKDTWNDGEDGVKSKEVSNGVVGDDAHDCHDDLLPFDSGVKVDNRKRNQIV